MCGADGSQHDDGWLLECDADGAQNDRDGDADANAGPGVLVGICSSDAVASESCNREDGQVLDACAQNREQETDGERQERLQELALYILRKVLSGNRIADDEC